MLENQVAPNMIHDAMSFWLSVIHFSCPVTSICRSCKPPTSTSLIPSCKCETLLCHCSFGYRNVERNIRNSTCVWLWVLINKCDIKWLLTLCCMIVFSTHFAVLAYDVVCPILLRRWHVATHLWWVNKNGHTRSPLTLWNISVNVRWHIMGDPKGVQLGNTSTTKCSIW